MFSSIAQPAAQTIAPRRTSAPTRVVHAVLGLGLALLLGLTATGGRALAATPDGPADVTEAGTSLIPGVAEGDIDAFWAARFAAAGYGYWTPPVIGFEAEISTGCGTVQPATFMAFYCTVDGAVYYSAKRTERAATIYGDGAWINIIAHEWGHHVQAMLGLNPEWRILNQLPLIEQEATCLEGVYVADAAARGLVDTATIGDMMRMFKGDEAHGTSEELEAAFNAGFSGGFAGCGVGLPEAGPGATSDAAPTTTEATPDAASASIAPGSTVRVTTAGVNLRTSPSTGAPVRTTLGLERTLLVTGAANEADAQVWWPVEDEATGETGYVAAEFLVSEG